MLYDENCVTAKPRYVANCTVSPRPSKWCIRACALRNAQAATLLEFMYHSRIVLSVGGSVWYMIRNLRCTVTVDSVLANSKTQNAFLFTVNAIFRQSRLPPSGGTWKYAKAPSTKKTWRDSLPINMLISAVSVLVVAQSSSEIPEGLMINPVLFGRFNSEHVCSVLL